MLIPVIAVAQNKPYSEVSIASPNAASLGKYADIPISYNTGTPQISIPIYTLKEGSLSLPISVSYHASGLKVMEAASWVGAGWALDAGGMITRSVNGGPDERGNNVGSIDKGHFTDYGFNNYLYEPGSINPVAQDWNGFADGYKDGEPDMFFFNFAGYSGKFYFRDDRTPILVPQQDLKIIPDYPGTGNIKSFTIVTPDGTKYYFGNTTGISGTPPVEISNPISFKNPNANGTVISSWFLNKIQSADNQFSINLNYSPENYGCFSLSMYPINSFNTSNVPLTDYHEYSVIKNLINGVRLNQITGSNDTISFIPGAIRTDLSDATIQVLPSVEGINTQATTLGSIKITNGSSLCKNFKFYYNYFIDNSTPLPTDISGTGCNLQSDKKRLRLDSLQEISCDSSIKIPPYRFSYFSDAVPRRINFGQDHWNFFNGITTNQTLIPTYTENDGVNTTSYPGANRDPAWPAMRGGTLQTISYPTGGYSTFEFEPHSTYVGMFTQTTLNTILSFSVHTYGQSSQYSNSVPLVGNGTYIISWTNLDPSYSGNLIIKNSSNVTVQNWPVVSNSSNQVSVTLAPDTYTATLSIPVGATDGIQATFQQWQTTSTPTNKSVGGLRIKTLTHNDGVTLANQVTNFEYASGSQSTGILYSIPAYVQIIRNDIIAQSGYYKINSYGEGYMEPNLCSINGCISCPNASYYKSPVSIRPMSTVQGNHIGYTQVKVSQAGNGYSIYKYYGTDPWNLTYTDVAIRNINTSGCNSNAPNSPAAPLPFDFLKGELKYEEHYNEGGQLLKDVYYYPVYDSTTIVKTPGFIVASYLGGNGQILGTFYNLNTYRKTKNTAITTAYTPGIGSIKDSAITYYGSQNHNQATRSVSFNSTGDSILSNYKYTMDYRVSAADAISDGAATYNSACNSCTVTYNNSRTNCNNNSVCLCTAYMDYQYCLANARKAYVDSRKINYTNLSNKFQQAHDSVKAISDANLKPLLELQDQFQNPLIETTQWINNKITSAVLNNYAFSTNPVSAVYPSKSQLINLSAPSTTFTNSAVSSNSITKDSRYTDEVTAVYQKGVPLQVKPKTSSQVSYLWGNNNNNPVAKASNAKYNEIYFEGFEEPGGWDSYLTGYDSTKSHSGKYSGKIVNTTSFEQVTRNTRPLTVSLTVATKYRYSGWVYSLGPSAEIFFFMKRAGEAGYYTYLDVIGTTEINKWVYLEKEFTVPSDAVILDMRVDNNNNGTIWFDDLRIQPSASIMNTYTYDPLVGMTSETDQNQHVKKYEYDGLGRLKIIRDQNNNIIKRICYNYYGQPSDCGVLISVPPPPPSVTITCNNYSSSSGFSAVYTNISNSQQYSFSLPTTGGTLGTIPAGNYNISISKPGNNTTLVFGVCSVGYTTGTSATFNNIAVSSESCNNIFIDTAF